MEWSDFSGKSVALLGAGLENLSLIAHLKAAKAKIFLCDLHKPDKKIDPAVKVITGPDHLNGLDKYDYVFRTPGMPTSVVSQAISGVSKPPIITSAVDLAFALIGRQIIAVTGTKGKGTTSTMITEIIKAAGRPVMLAGNIGVSIFDSWKDITEETVVVMEVSSFQLEDVTHSPHVAVVLPISPDHLQPLSPRSPNYHESLPAYIHAKEKITAHQGGDDFIIFSLDSQPSEQIGAASSAKKVSVSAVKSADVMVRSGVLEIGSEQINLTERTRLRGDHLFHNAAVACAVANILKINVHTMVEGLNNFRPLPHRMQEIGQFDGVTYVDDSYATAPEAAIAALSAYRDRPVILILGGSSKGADFSELSAAISRANIKAVILIGQEAKKIESALHVEPNAPTILSGYKTFRDAVETAVRRATHGDVVMLSPACASKDMFENAAQRGDQFTKIVHELV